MALLPLERTDEHHVTKHTQILGLPGRESLELVFLGDSLTRRWEDNPDQWTRYFGAFRAANFGVGADTVENVLWRVGNGELDGLKPRLLVLLIGTNNLPKDSPPDILEGIGRLLDLIRRILPATRILVLGLLPRNPDETGRDYAALVPEVNQGLRDLADGSTVFFEDFGALFPSADGRVDPAVMPDGLHLNGAGYDRLGPALAAVVRALSGL